MKGVTDYFDAFADIDECTNGLHDCSAENSECINTVGSYRCQCKPGYILSGNTCIGKEICLLKTVVNY